MIWRVKSDYIHTFSDSFFHLNIFFVEFQNVSDTTYSSPVGTFFGSASRSVVLWALMVIGPPGAIGR